MSPAPLQRSELELAELSVRTNFCLDAAGRMVWINERPPLRRPPRLYLIWTRAGTVCGLRDDVPAALAARVRELVAAEPPATDLSRLPRCLNAVRAALEAHGPVTDAPRAGGPDYRFPAPDAQTPPLAGAASHAGTAADGADVVWLGPDNAHLLHRWLPAWIPDAGIGEPTAAVLVDGAAVAICATVRMPGEAAAAGVEAHPAFRGRGYAPAATAAWARAIHERGIVPLYGTSWDNLASQRVAAKLGLIQFGASLGIE